MTHCLTKIQELVTIGRNDRRSIFQLGYNLGRLSEMTGLGREPFWDAWKSAVETWDYPKIIELARHLPELIPEHPDNEVEVSERALLLPRSPDGDVSPRGDI